MRIRALFITASAFTLLALPALAQESAAVQSAASEEPHTGGGMSPVFDPCCVSNVTVVSYAKVASGYILQDIGIVATDKPVLQGGTSVIYGNGCYVDLWASVQLSGGSYGSRGPGDEVDLTGQCERTLDSTPLGPLVVQGQLGVYFFDLGQGLGSTRDDMLEFQFDVARPVKLNDNFTVTPFVHPEGFVGIGDLDSIYLLRTGVRVDYRIDEHWNIGGDVAETFNLDPGGQSVTRYTLYGNYRVNDNWSVKAAFDDTDQTAGVWSLGFSHTW